MATEEKVMPGQTPDLVRLFADLAVSNERTGEMKEQLKGILDKLDKLESRFVLKSEHEDLRKSVDRLERNIGWGVKTVLGLVIAAVFALISFKGGLPIHS